MIKDKVLRLDSFNKIEGLVHGFSTKKHRSMKKGESKTLGPLLPFLKTLGIPKSSVVGMNQVHSSHVVAVGDGEKETVIKETDGLLTNTRGLFLSATVADCVPILFYDRKKKVAGAVHAGWRGLLAEIPQKMISEMKKKGSNTKDIIVGIGPSIRVCCYEVGEGHVVLFSKKFGKWAKDIFQRREGKLFLDLQKLATLQLTASGIVSTGIEDMGLCTMDKRELCYSYRAGDRGQMAAVIGVLS